MSVEMSRPGSVRVEAVRKTFPKRIKPALAGFDLRVDAGRVCALLGANGARKTTLARIIATLTGKDSRR